MAEKKPKETPKEEKVIDIVDDFVSRKLKAINEMDDNASAKFLAQRVLANKRGKK